jgi:hypothetical protein
MKNKRSRPIGFEMESSIEPSHTKSGKIEHVEIKARIVAIQASQMVTRKPE